MIRCISESYAYSASYSNRAWNLEERTEADPIGECCL